MYPLETERDEWRGMLEGLRRVTASIKQEEEEEEEEEVEEDEEI